MSASITAGKNVVVLSSMAGEPIGTVYEVTACRDNKTGRTEVRRDRSFGDHALGATWDSRDHIKGSRTPEFSYLTLGRLRLDRLAIDAQGIVRSEYTYAEHVSEFAEKLRDFAAGGEVRFGLGF